MNSLITIILNGENFSCSCSISILELLQSLNLNEKFYIIELNGIVIQSIDYKKTLLKNKDKLEIITYMGGGSI